MTDPTEIRVEPIDDTPPYGFRVWVGTEFVVGRPDKHTDGADEPFSSLAFMCRLARKGIVRRTQRTKPAKVRA